MEWVPNDKVVNAIEQLKLQVTAPAIAVHTGLSLDEVQKEVEKLFPLCGDGFEVRIFFISFAAAPF